jgi:hypothetical protein
VRILGKITLICGAFATYLPAQEITPAGINAIAGHVIGERDAGKEEQVGSLFEKTRSESTQAKT